MDMQPEQGNLLRWYLLGATTPEEDEQIEKRLRSAEASDELLLVEEDLIDDYARGILPASERELFEENFLTTPEREQKLLLAKAAVKYANTQVVSAKAAGVGAFENTRVDDIDQGPQDRHQPFTENREPRLHVWWRALVAPGWKIAAWAALVIAVILGAWFWWPSNPSLEQVQIALNQAYHKQRPLEARITGFDYASYVAPSNELGGRGEDSEVNYVALERAKIILFGSNANVSNPAVLHALGRYYMTQKEFEKAIENLQQALQHSPKSAQIHSDLGAAWLGKLERDRRAKNERREADLNESLTHLNIALELDPKLREALFNRALLQQHERLRRQARDDWERYLQLDPDSPWAKEARQNLREINAELQKVSQRKGQIYQEFLHAVQTGDDEGILRTFSLSYSFSGNEIVERLVDSFLAAKFGGQSNEAEDKLRVLLHLGSLSRRKTGDRFTEDLARYYQQAQPEQLNFTNRARDLMRRAYKFYRSSENDCAIELYGHAKQLFMAAGNAGESLFATAWIGQCHHQRADTERNLPIFTELVPLFERKQYRWMQANAACGLANGHEAIGRFSNAIDDTLQCQKLSAQVGDQTGVIRGMYIRGGFYQYLGRHDEALRLSQQGMLFADEIAAEIRYAIAFYHISSFSLSRLGMFEAARAFQLEAVGMAEETDSPRIKARAYIYLGLLYGKWKKFDQAIVSLKSGIAIGRQLGGDRTGQELVHYGLVHLGGVYREAGKFGEALKVFNQVIDFFRLSGRQIYLYAGSKGRLLTLIAQEEDQAACAELDQVIELYEKYRQQIQEESNRNSFFDQEQGIYDVAIEFAFTRLGNPRQALKYSEYCRARSLLDISRRGWNLVASPNALELKVSSENPPADPEEIRRQLPEQVQLIEYAALEDKLLIWVIDKSRPGEVCKAVPVSLSELTRRINQFLALINRKPSQIDERWREPAKELYNLLVKPVEDRLDERKQICIVPDKVLTLLPFAALVFTENNSDKFWVEKYGLIYASSASMFLNSTEKARQKKGVRPERLLAVWNPQFDPNDFPTLDVETSSPKNSSLIESFYPQVVSLAGAKAEKHALLRDLNRVDVAHFATHYVADSWSPMLSRMPLAASPGSPQEGVLQMYELYRLGALSPRLVILAACQTRVEDYFGGEGAIGFSRPFEAAGVPLVVASLWPVDAPATEALMVAFHRTRKQAAGSTVEALRAGQLEMLRATVSYQHPYYWAAFITVGGFSEF